MGARRARRWAGFLTGVVLTALALVALTGTPASAHANLLDSNPTDGAMLNTAPTRLTLHMSESVELADTTVVIVDGHGGQIASGAVRLLRKAGSGTEVPSTLVVALPPLPADTYRVTWATLSSDDLHPTRGVLVFGVHRAVVAANATPTDPPPGATESAVRAVGFLALAGALGAWVLLGLLRRTRGLDEEAAHRARIRLRTLMVVGAGATLVADVVLLGVQAAGPGTGFAGTMARLLGSGSYAPRWWTQQAAVGALLAGAALGLRRERSGRPAPTGWVPRVGGVLVLAALGGTAALLSHPAASGPLWIVVDAVHQCAALVWTGGVLAAAVALGARSGERRGLARAVLRGFSLVAVGCVVVLAVSGLLLAGNGVASVDALLFSGYGRVLLVKLGLALLVGLAGLVNTALLRDWLSHRAKVVVLARTVVVEAVLAALLLGAAATLGSASPATGPRWAASPASSTLATQQADDLVESIRVTPNTPGGANFVTVQIFDTRRPAPGPVTEVTVTLRGTDGTLVTGTAQPAGNGSYVLPSDRLTAGQWYITVTVARVGLPPAVTGTDWELLGPSVNRQPVVSRQPLAPVLDGIALALLGVSVLTALAVALWRRRRAQPAAPDPSTEAQPEPGQADVDRVGAGR